MTTNNTTKSAAEKPIKSASKLIKKIEENMFLNPQPKATKAKATSKAKVEKQAPVKAEKPAAKTTAPKAAAKPAAKQEQAKPKAEIIAGTVSGFCVEHGINPKVGRAALRRNGLSGPYTLTKDVKAILLALLKE